MGTLSYDNDRASTGILEKKSCTRHGRNGNALSKICHLRYKSKHLVHKALNESKAQFYIDRT
ncbi:hypothetical protein KXD40_000858 [Peronospora effusa]|nr:hypothetical protein KXD40_000858 [Peronospora effusa]